MALTFIAGFAAACSSDNSRFGENPFGNPFQGKVAQRADNTTTGSIGNPSRPKSSALPTSNAGVSSPTYIGNAANWSAEGGTPVTLADGDTVMTLANRYGVPPQAILQANGLRSASDAHPGQSLTIPVYKSAAAAAPGSVVSQPLPPRPATAMQALPPTKPPMLARPQVAEHVLRADPKVAARVVPLKVKDADDEDEKPAKVKASARANLAAKPLAPVAVAKVIPVAKAIAAPKEAPVAPVKLAAKVEPAKPEVKAKVAAVQPKAVEPTPVKSAEPEQTGSLPKADDASATDFRWPARGRVISAYTKGGNDGINISVPEGTPVKSADGGTVAYAGSELKGYGNLVLVRHPNGFVTAYANNGELLVKRGQAVTRGQVIAKSGQTGNVSAPQLHFELRKGATPVDPTPYLN